MTTPSERIWRSPDEDVLGPAPYLPAQPRAPSTLAGCAQLVAVGEDIRVTVREFLDDWALARDDADRMARVTAEPALVDPHADAYLAALAEHVCVSANLPGPPWAVKTERFLESWWWPSSTPGLAAIALAESPAAFRRRGIFIGATTLHRV